MSPTSRLLVVLAAINLLKTNPNVNTSEFEDNCGIDVVYTPEQLEKAVSLNCYFQIPGAAISGQILDNFNYKNMASSLHAKIFVDWME